MAALASALMPTAWLLLDFAQVMIPLPLSPVGLSYLPSSLPSSPPHLPDGCCSTFAQSDFVVDSEHKEAELQASFELRLLQVMPPLPPSRSRTGWCSSSHRSPHLPPHPPPNSSLLSHLPLNITSCRRCPLQPLSATLRGVQHRSTCSNVFRSWCHGAARSSDGTERRGASGAMQALPDRRTDGLAAFM